MVRRSRDIEIVVDNGSGQRLDAWVSSALQASSSPLSRSAAQKLIQAQQVLLNGKAARPKDLVKTGDCISIAVPEKTGLQPIAMDIEILFEDDALLVVNKPKHLAVHPGAGPAQPTLVQALLSKLPPGGDRPGVVHRLDKDTSGVLVLAKSAEAAAGLQAQFKDRSVVKLYWALLDSPFEQETQAIESQLLRDPRQRLRFTSVEEGGKFAKSEFRRLESYGATFSLAEIRIYTGRTHQIRVHAKELGMPILGDLLYNRTRDFPQTFDAALIQWIKGRRSQLLHARQLDFVHPLTGAALSFTAALPLDFEEGLRLLEPYRDLSR